MCNFSGVIRWKYSGKRVLNRYFSDLQKFITYSSFNIFEPFFRQKFRLDILFISYGQAESQFWAESLRKCELPEDFNAETEFLFHRSRYCKNHNFYDFYRIASVLEAWVHKFCWLQLCFRSRVRIMLRRLRFMARFVSRTRKNGEKVAQPKNGQCQSLNFSSFEKS